MDIDPFSGHPSTWRVFTWEGSSAWQEKGSIHYSPGVLTWNITQICSSYRSHLIFLPFNSLWWARKFWVRVRWNLDELEEKRCGVSHYNVLIPLFSDIPQVISTLMCIISQTRNEKASEFQLITCIYLLACGASRSLFSVLNHAGFSLSYSSAMSTIKDLGEEQLETLKKLICNQACLVVWDNLNITFWVNEQHQASKDHFDNGTTATLILLYDILFNSIPLSPLPWQSTRCITFDMEPNIDLLPSLQQVTELKPCMLWHIKDILFTAFPELHQWFKDINCDPPSVLLIPVHKTEQHPLHAALIDESTIDRTLDVMDHIFFWTLGLTAEEIEKHRLFILAGDQLTNALSNTVCFMSYHIIVIDFVSRSVVLITMINHLLTTPASSQKHNLAFLI